MEMSIVSTDVSSSDCTAFSINKKYSELLQHELKKRKVSLRDLERQGIIRTRLKFIPRLERGSLNPEELWAIFRHLDIHPIQTAIALTVSQDVPQYDSPQLENLCAITIALVELFIDKQKTDHVGPVSFDPLNKTSAQQAAQIVFKMMVDHQRRVDNARERLVFSA